MFSDILSSGALWWMNYRAPTDDGNSEQTVQRPVYVSDAHELWMGTFTPEEQTPRAL